LSSYYSHFRFVVQEIQATNDGILAIQGIKYFGTPAPSGLEDGHLTLGKALTLPRVSGHPAGAETPRAESLVIHYDTTVDSVVSGSTVVDISGTGVNGTLTNGAAYSSTDRALTFDGVNDYVSGTLNNPAGAWVHSVSCWYKPLSTTEGVVWAVGTNALSKQIAINNYNGTIKYYIYGCDAISSPTTTFTTNKWHHIVAVFRNSETTAGGGVLTGRDVYIDGVKQTMTAVNTQVALNLNADTTFRLANQYNSLYNHGSISNFKLWNVALTAEEVAAEYALGRTGKSINLTDTSLCLGGTVPRAQLDVRGSALVGGNVGIGTDSPSHKLTVRAASGDAEVHIQAQGNGSNGAIIYFNGSATNQRKCAILSSPINSWCKQDLHFCHNTSQNYDDVTIADSKMVIKNTGRVGIGTTSPIGNLHIKQNQNDYWIQGAGIRIEPNQTGPTWGMIVSTFGAGSGGLYFGVTNDGGSSYTDMAYLSHVTAVNQLDFTGQHRSFIDDVPYTEYDNLEGLIVSANKNKYFDINEDITTGANAIQISQSLPLVSLSTKEKDKACFGVISGSEDPEKREYEQGTFVSVVQKQKGDRRAFINSVGEGAMWVTDINGPLESGDYITTSNVAGYGQKQDSEFLANYTVAKITMDCDFDPVTQPVQRIIKELANVNYWVKTTVSNVSVEEYSNLAEENRTTEDETYYTKDVQRKYTYKPTVTVTAEDQWDDVSVWPSDVTYAEWSNLEANVQNTYTLTYTQNDFESMRYEKTTVSNVTSEDEWDAVHIEPPTVTYAEYSNLEANVQNTFTLTYTKSVTTTTSAAYYSNLTAEDQELYTAVYLKTVTEDADADTEGADAHVRTIYKKIEREETKEERDDEEWVLDVREELENALDEHGQLQWEDHPTETEKAYKIRYLDASGQQTDEANCVHKAAFVGVTYHCG
jgi:hypothetical protein